MSETPWYTDEKTREHAATAEIPSDSPALSSTNEVYSPDAERAKQQSARIRQMPAGKNRVDRVIDLVHDMDPREFNNLVASLSVAEQDELTQRLMKLRKKKGTAKANGPQNWYLQNPEAEDERSTGSIILWWEARRIPYNLIVGATGLIPLIVLSAMSSSAVYSGTFFAVLAYGIMANICYTSGWIAELIARKVFAEKANHFGPIALFLGTSFSVLLTLSPLILMACIFFLSMIFRA